MRFPNPHIAIFLRKEVYCSNCYGNSSFTLSLSADTVPPTASVTASRSFTNASNVSVNISFSEPCNGGGGFGCSSVNTCNVSRCQMKIIMLLHIFQQ